MAKTPEVRSVFAGALRMARLRAGLSIRAMARRAGISHGWVIKVESGRPLTERVILRYCRALGLDIEVKLIPRESSSEEAN